MGIYKAALETQVYAEEGYIFISQKNGDYEDMDLIQLNADQAAWLLAELEVVMREAK